MVFCIFQTCLALKRAFQPGNKYVFKAFSGEKGRSLVRSLCTPWEALLNKNLAIQTCLRGWYQARFFGLIFGHSWGIGEGPGWHLVRYLCETRKALHERHVWKTLRFTRVEHCDLPYLGLEPLMLDNASAQSQLVLGKQVTLREGPLTYLL